MTRVVNKKSVKQKNRKAYISDGGFSEEGTYEMANEIIEGLWLGDGYAAERKDFFEENNISCVVNCTSDLPHYLMDKKNDIEYMRLEIEDDLTNESIDLMTKYLFPVAMYIFKNRDLDNRVVYVHCHAGMQRSAIVVCAYLVICRGMTPKEAIDLVKKMRPRAFHHGKNVNFEESLMTYANFSSMT